MQYHNSLIQTNNSNRMRARANFSLKSFARCHHSSNAVRRCCLLALHIIMHESPWGYSVIHHRAM